MLVVRGHGEGSIFQRADGRWVAVISLEDGRRRSRYAKSKPDARLRLAELQRMKAAGTVEHSRLTLGQYLSTWLVDVKPRLAPATWRKHEQHIRNHIGPALGGRRLSELSVAHVRAFLAADGLDPQTVRHHRATLRRALADGLRDGLVTRNVAALAEPPDLTHRERSVLTAEQVRVLIDGTRDDPLHALWTLLATTGLREAEALALTWEDIDLGDARDHGRELATLPATRDVLHGVPGANHPPGRPVGPSVRVHRTLHRIDGQWQMRPPKTAKSRRTVFLPAVTVEALREHRRSQLERWIAAGRPGDGLMVFTTNRGMPMHGANLSKQLRATLVRLGLPVVVVHSLRHSAATILYAEGIPIETIADMLGHSTPRITAELYRHRVDELQRTAADAMERAVG